jgi:hypothetical protein
MRQPISQFLPQRADTLSGVLDHGFELYARSFWRVTGFFALAGLVSAVFGLLTQGPQGTLGILLGAGRFADAFARYWWMVPMWLALLFALLIIYNAAYVRISAIGVGADIGFVDSLKRGYHFAWRTLGLMLMLYFLLIVGCAISAAWMYVTATQWGDPFASGEFPLVVNVLMVIAWLAPPLLLVTWLMMPCLLAPYALVLRGQGVFAAIETGFALTFGQFWRSVVAMSVPGALFTIAYSGVMAVMIYTVVRGALSPNSAAFNAVVQLLGVPILAVLAPLFVCTVMALFNDLMLRRDGSDLTQRIEAIR